MKDLRKQGQILLKRNGFWVLLVFFLVLLFTGIMQNKIIDSTYSSIISDTNDLNLIGKTGRKYDYGTRIDKNFFEENENLYEDLAQKYEIDKYNNFDYDRASEKEKKDFDDYIFKNGEYLKTINSYNNTKEKFFYNKDSFLLDSFAIILVLVLAFLFTSLEHATSYYEFSKMYPWSRKKDFLMKLAIGAVIIFLFTILSSFLSYMIISTSYFDILKIGLGFLPSIIKNLINLLIMYLIFMSTGILAGNIIGHLGLSSMTLLFLDLLDLIFANVKNIFTGDDKWGGGIHSLLDKTFPKGDNINTIIRTVLRPVNEFDQSNESLIGLFIFSLIVFFIAFNLIESIKTEKSGRMIMIRPIEILAKVMIIIITASSGTLLFQNSVFNGFSMINIIIFAILIYVYTKIFNILFNLKLKV